MKRLWHYLHGGPFIVLLLTLLVVAMLGGLAGQQTVMAGPPCQEGEEDYSGQSCADCHLDHKASWETGVHSIAYDRASFQEAWVAEGNDPECLSCHTTNYRPFDESYDAENIQCEACHGENPANHPPEEFIVSTNATMCGDCHTTTFAEWERSAHAFTEDMGTVGCSTCHNPHGQTLRFDSVDALCLNCHGAAPNTYVHLTHNEIAYEVDGAETAVNCADCHMYNAQLDELHNLADHSMSVGTESCTACHEALSLTGQFDVLVDVDTALAEERDALREQVETLETELAVVTEEVEMTAGTDYVQLTQGLILGLGIGVTIVWVVMRRETNGNNKTK